MKRLLVIFLCSALLPLAGCVQTQDKGEPDASESQAAERARVHTELARRTTVPGSTPLHWRKRRLRSRRRMIIYRH